MGTVTVVAAHVDNPRGLAFGPDGHLYVAEAGHGGSDCPPGAKSPEGQPVCFGLTGALARLGRGKATPVYRGLASLADPAGIAAEGPSGLVWSGNVWQLVMGLSSQQTVPGLSAADAKASKAQLGRLVAIDRKGGHGRVVADVGGDDYRWSQRHHSYEPQQFPDANPFGAFADGKKTYVADAGTNLLTEVTGSKTSPLAFFPNPPVSDSVPTCVAKGPDGALYVGELTGAGNKAGAARIWRLVVNHKPTVWRTGLSNVAGCGFDAHNNFYAVELQTAAFNPGPNGDPRGAVIKIAPNGTRTQLGYGKLFYPQGFAVSGNGLFVSNWSIFPASAGSSNAPTGQVVRIQI